MKPPQLQLPQVKFTLTSRDLLIHRPYAEVFTYYISVCVIRQGTKYCVLAANLGRVASTDDQYESVPRHSAGSLG